MGGCLSNDQLTPNEKKRQREHKIITKWIDDDLKTRQEEDKSCVKLLFLGAGESGKSTMLKQMKILYSKQEPFSAEDRNHFTGLIHSNILQSARTLAAQVDVLAQKFPEQNFELSPAAKQARQFVLDELKYSDPVSARAVEQLKILWRDDGIQAAFRMRSQFQLNDSTEYYFGRVNHQGTGDNPLPGRLDAVAAPDYIPDNQDILRARIRTTGIVEHTFHIEKNDFKIYDVGGQRNARKKWIHCFDNVTSVIFVAALSAFDTRLYEDETTNRMDEALALFEDILNLQYFGEMPMILFLNKKDIFREKIEREGIPLSSAFSDYNGPPTYRETRKFIKGKFLAKNSKNPNRQIYPHYTNATDTTNFEKVFNVVQQIILRVHLEEVGLLAPGADLDNREDEEEFEDEADNYLQ